MNFLEPWKLAMEVDNHFNSTVEGAFTLEELKDITETFQGLGGNRQCKKVCGIFKTLPKAEVIRRTSIAAKLTHLLLTVKINAHDLCNIPIPSKQAS